VCSYSNLSSKMQSCPRYLASGSVDGAMVPQTWGFPSPTSGICVTFHTFPACFVVLRLERVTGHHQRNLLPRRHSLIPVRHRLKAPHPEALPSLRQRGLLTLNFHSMEPIFIRLFTKPLLMVCLSPAATSLNVHLWIILQPK